MWYGACFGGGCLVGMVVMMFLLSGWVRQYTKEGTPSASHNSVSREIKCSNRECDFRNKNGVCTHRGGQWCNERRTLHPA